MPRQRTATKTVVRKYYSKKLGQVVTKTYVYDAATKARYAHKSTTERAFKKRVVSSTGRIYKAGTDIMKQYNSVSDQAYIQDIIRRYRTQGKLSKLTVGRLTYELTREKIISALDNTGYSFEEIADQIGTDVDDLINPVNWSGSIYTDPKTGKQYQYQWTYTGTVLNVIN